MTKGLFMIFRLKDYILFDFIALMQTKRKRKNKKITYTHECSLIKPENTLTSYCIINATSVHVACRSNKYNVRQYLLHVRIEELYPQDQALPRGRARVHACALYIIDIARAYISRHYRVLLHD